MAAPAPTRFDTVPSTYRAMDEMIAKVTGKHTFTTQDSYGDQVRMFYGPYNHFMTVLNYDTREILAQLAVPNAIGTHLEGGVVNGNFTHWKKTITGPEELQETTNNFQNILAFAKMFHEQQVRAAQAAQAAQAAMAAMAARPREP